MQVDMYLVLFVQVGVVLYFVGRRISELTNALRRAEIVYNDSQERIGELFRRVTELEVGK